jgi:hypothetical protein
MWRGFKRFWHDQFTTANGDFDPARFWGYSIVGAGGMLFLYLSWYSVQVKGATFDPSAFGDGLTKVGAALLVAATGVWIKHGTEVPYNPTVAAANMPDDPGVQAAAGNDSAAPDPAAAAAGAQMTLDGMSALAQDEIAQAKTLTDKLKQLWGSVKNIFK